MKHYLTKHLLSSRIWILAMIICAGFTNSAFAQDSKGTEFWICFPGNQQSPNPELYITSPQASTVTIDIPGIGFNQVVNVPAGGLQVVSIPGTAQVQSQFVADNKGIHITATNEVTVYGMNAQQATTDAYLAFPIDAIGTEYYVMAYNRDFSFLLPTQATILATQNNTTVTITSSLTDGSFIAGVPANITLQQGEVYQLRSLIDGADYTGTKVTADKPISVFGGAQCTNISGTLRACDHLVEQMPPLSSWGKSFLTVPLATRLQGDVFRFMAQVNGTAVSVNGAVVANLNGGEFFEIILGSTTFNRITSNQPILVGQYSRSSEADGVTSDPFFALVPPDEQFLNSYVVSAGTANIPSNFLNITSPTSNTGTVMVDGAVVSAGAWTAIQATGFSGAKVPIANGVHTVTSSLPIGLLIYGFGSFDSYGYLGGQSFSPVATVSTLVLAPKGATSPVNVNKCFTATVKDQFSAPVVGVRVDFGITGPNSTATGFANTDASGVATFCYTGTVDGTDNITASVGSISDAATFVWTPVNNTCNIVLSGVVCNPSCYLSSNGAISLGVTGGTAPFTYLWSNGAITKNLYHLKDGTYSVTVTDHNGCTAEKSFTLVQPPKILHKIVVSPNPTVPGHALNTIFLGYGPQSVTLTAMGSGGTGVVSYDWGALGTNASIVVSPTVPTSYTCSFKDSKGCVITSVVKINVVDVRCGANNDKVLICHKIRGCATPQTLCVAATDVATYLAAGDKLGVCPGGTPPPSQRGIIEVSSSLDLKAGEVKAFPNPASSYLDVQWKTITAQNEAVLNVFDVKGVLVMSYKAGNINIKRLDISKLGNGLYLLQVLGVGNTALTSKFVVQK
jgi:IgGFc binding protein/Bacterial Ig-like domain (group 1)/Secretion system C-terminal sorting domain/SprB repeat